MKRVSAFVTGLMLLLAMGAFANGKSSTSSKSSTTKQHTTKTAVTRQASGTISSVNGNDLVLSHKVRGKEEQTTFMMNDKTRKEGELRAGERATVHYKIENGQDIATMVKARPSMASSAKSNNSKTSSSDSSSTSQHKRS